MPAAYTAPRSKEKKQRASLPTIARAPSRRHTHTDIRNNRFGNQCETCFCQRLFVGGGTYKLDRCGTDSAERFPRPSAVHPPADRRNTTWTGPGAVFVFCFDDAQVTAGGMPIVPRRFTVAAGWSCALMAGRPIRAPSARLRGSTSPQSLPSVRSRSTCTFRSNASDERGARAIRGGAPLGGKSSFWFSGGLLPLLRGDRKPTIDWMYVRDLETLMPNRAYTLLRMLLTREAERTLSTPLPPPPPPLLLDTISTYLTWGFPESRDGWITGCYSGGRQPSVGCTQARESINEPVWTVNIRKTGVKCPPTM